MGLTDWTAYLSAAKTVLDLFKGIRAELPTGPKSQQIKEQIDKAEGALKASEAELAKALGYKLCQCTFPPQIMLWSERTRRASVNYQCLTIHTTERENRADLRRRDRASHPSNPCVYDRAYVFLDILPDKVSEETR